MDYNFNQLDIGDSRIWFISRFVNIVDFEKILETNPLRTGDCLTGLGLISDHLLEVRMGIVNHP